MSSDIQSVEISYFLQMTEDGSKLTSAVAALIGADIPAEKEEVEGHFGNKIIWVKHHMTGDIAEAAIDRIVTRIASEERRTILSDLSTSMDEHNALYLRLNKQVLIDKGEAVLGDSDPIRVRVKPRPYKVKGDPEGFYQSLLERRTSG